MVTPRRDDPAGADALTAATVAWLTFGGGERPRGFETRPGWSALIWSHEMWNWGEAELVQKYSQHRETVDALDCTGFTGERVI